MLDHDITREQLIAELAELRQKYHAACQAEPKQLAIEKEFHRTDRALKTFLACNKTLLSSNDENELLAGICQNSLTVGGYKMAWIGFALQDEQKTVLPVAQAGYEDGYLGTVNITWDDAERGQGPTGTAIRTGKPSILNNILTEPRFAPWRAEAVKRGYVSVIGLPFSVDGHMSGALTIYAPEPEAFGKHEVDLLMELVNNLSFGITSLRTRAAQKQAEDALRTSEERFSAIANTTTDAVMMTDAQGTIMYWNPAAEHIFGYTADEILGKDAQIIRPERHRATENRNRNLFLTTGSSAYVGKTVEGIALKKDGTEFFIEVSTSHWQQNSQVFFSGIIRDITDRKRTEIELGSYSKSLEDQVKARTAELTEAIVNLKQEMVQHKQTETALRASERNFRTLVELSPDGIGIEQKGTVVFVNSAGAKLLGAESPDQIIGKPIVDVIHPDYVEIVQNRIKDIARLKKAVPFIDEKLLRLDGQAIDVEVGSALCFFNNKPAAQVVFRDITDKKLFDTALRKSEEQFRSVVQTSSDAIITLDRTGSIISWNSGAENIFGYTAEEIMHKPLLLLIPERLHSLHSAIMTDLSAAQFDNLMIAKNLSWGIKKDGSEFPMEGSAAQWETAEGFFITLTIRDIAEQQQTQEALRRSEEQYRSVIETASDAIITTNIQGNIISWNKAAEQLYGYSADEINNMSFAMLLPGHYDSVQQQKMLAFFACQNNGIIFQNNELPTRRKDDSEFPAEGSVLKWNTREGSFLTAIVRDISKRKHAEELLRSSEERFRNLAQSASDAIVLADDKGAIIFWNKSAEAVFGYTEAEIIEKPVNILLPEQFRASNLMKFDTLKSTGQSPYIGKILQTLALKKDDTEFPSEVSLSYWTVGNRKFYSAIIRDVTERARVEAALRESEEKFRTMADNICTGLFIYQGNRFVYANPAAETISGYTHEEYLNMNFWEHIHPDYREMVKERGIRRQAGEEVPSRYEMQIIHKTGEVRWVDYTAATIAYNGRNAILGTVADITDRKLSEVLITMVNSCLLSFTPDPDSNIQRIVEVAGASLGGACAAYHKKQGSFLNIKADWNIPAEFKKLHPWKADPFLKMLAEYGGNPFIISSVDHMPFITKDSFMYKLPFKTFIALPVKMHDTIIGSLNISYKNPKIFNHNELNALSILAKAIAIEEERKRVLSQLDKNQQKLKASQKALKSFTGKLLSVREEEQKHIATTLHDELGSLVIALSSGLAITREDIIENNIDQALQGISQTESALKHAVESLKKIAIDLRPPNLDILGLSNTLKNYLNSIAVQKHLKLDFAIDIDDKRISQNTAISLYRVCQEGLNNIIKHAKAKNVSIQLSATRQDIHLLIADDGIGCESRIFRDIARLYPKMGIIGMKERIESLGGKFNVETAVGHGTSIHVTVPYH